MDAQPQLPCPSPCVRHCGIDESLHCSGCMRTGREVGAWLTMSDAEKWNLLEELGKRKLPSGEGNKGKLSSR
ncbi:MAG: DUF1289 domain-containing protein [Armatimonadota bacterium]